MDPAIFIRNRRTLAGWIATPVLLIMGVYQGTHLYCRSVEAELEQDQTMMEIIPDLRNGLHRSQEALSQFSPDGAENSQDWDMLLNEMRNYFGFLVESANTTETPATSKKDRPSVAIRLEGTGSLVSTMRFLSMLQRPGNLVTIKSAKIQLTTQSRDGDAYRGRFVLQYHPVKGPAGT